MTANMNHSMDLGDQRILMAGFGGQGIMLMGQALATAAMAEGKEVSWLPSYGPEMRGGTANCAVILSDKPIRSPIIDQDASSAIIMNAPSFDSFEHRVRPSGFLLLNSSLVTREPSRTDVQIVRVPGTDLASELNNVRVANMIMLGAWLEITSYLTLESIVDVLRSTFGTKKPELVELNRSALEVGMAQVSLQQTL